MPNGSLIDAAGRPTNDPGTGFIADHAGALLSFGKPPQGIRPGGLARNPWRAPSAVDSARTSPCRAGILNSMLATVIDLSKPAIPPASARASKPPRRTSAHHAAPGFDEVLLPGEPELRNAKHRAQAGIEVDDTTWRDIREAAAKLGITEAEIDRTVRANCTIGDTVVIVGRPRLRSLRREPGHCEARGDAAISVEAHNCPNGSLPSNIRIVALGWVAEMPQGKGLFETRQPLQGFCGFESHPSCLG